MVFDGGWSSVPAEIWPRPLLSRSLLGLWRWPPDDRVHLPFATHQRIRLWGVCVSCHLYANLPCPGARPLRSNCSSRPVSEYTCQSFEIGRAHVLNSSHEWILYEVFCLEKKIQLYINLFINSYVIHILIIY